MVAYLYACPMATNISEPLTAGIFIRRNARKVVTRFDAAGPGFLDRALAAHDAQASGMGKVGFERFDGPGVDGALFNASVAADCVDKKGVPTKPSSACALAHRLG